ncbi:hypothetical protein A6R68_03490, partial [Neotoma lepida]
LLVIPVGDTSFVLPFLLLLVTVPGWVQLESSLLPAEYGMKFHGPGEATMPNVLDLALLLLVVLWVCQCSPHPSDMHFLFFNFTVEASSRSGKSWLTVQCSMDGMPLLEYDNANKAKLLGSLGKEVNSTKALTDLTQTLEEMGQEFRKRLLHMKLKTGQTKGHPTLQVNMCCQNERGQNTGASLLFSVNEQNSILFNAKTMTWTEVNPEARRDKEEWENDKELEKELTKFSRGDCNHWLNEFLKHLTEIPSRCFSMLLFSFLICDLICSHHQQLPLQISPQKQTARVSNVKQI